ncbi:chemotaxis protein CheD [Telmatobacter sp. DSM 110680]|uniref:Probable chemoreceptor glutamine deamidase CheD n=1 Tax=Telmatobacter sp. DSM 110680 TaxID=3036704 RepID=A0AAU7DMA1_9BACT
MRRLAPDLPEFYLQPGEWRIVRSPSILKTVLGSCVSATFHAPRLATSAMCHPMLPTHSAKPLVRPDKDAACRYVDYVIREIAHQFDSLGATRREVEVKLFGGADVLASSRKNPTVGSMNAETALRVLQDEGFQLLASRLGGSCGIFIEFQTGTGEVLLRKLSGMSLPALAES